MVYGGFGVRWWLLVSGILWWWIVVLVFDGACEWSVVADGGG